jgi:penicillin-binding protein 1A
MTPLTLTGAAFGLLGGLTVALDHNLPSEQDLPVILTSPQVYVDARYLAPGAQGEYARHAVCRCGLPLGADQIPPLLKEALLVQEDTHFYVHSGIDWIGLGRAFQATLSGGPVQGGSTLTQQLAKNLITGNARSGFGGMMRKVREALIARRIEHVMTKDEIITAYLNQSDFGTTGGVTAIGIFQAARKYFGKPVRDLNLYESAMLVGTLRATSLYNPIANPEAADHQARAVLEKMLQQNRIGQHEFSRAVQQGIQAGPLVPVDIGTGYYVAWARGELADIAAAHRASGLVRYVVGLDAGQQAQGEATIRDMIDRNQGRHVGQGALVAMDGDGRVAALVGGAGFAESQYDHAAQAVRQPGSAFKLFVYTAAIQAGHSPDSIRQDVQVSIEGWSPDDADHRHLGPIPLRTAFALSKNTVAAQLGAEVGPDAIATIAHELGIKSPLHRVASLALGTSEVTLLELTSAYVPFMSDGRPVRPHAARMALNARGGVIYRRNLAPLRPAVNARTLTAMRSMLRAVVTEGTGRQARLRDRWNAGKTGTTQDYRDAWFIGFTDRLTTGIWFGNDDSSPMNGVSGANMPAVAWRGFNEAIAQPFPKSSARPVPDDEKVARGAPWKPPLPRPAPEVMRRPSTAFWERGRPARSY